MELSELSHTLHTVPYYCICPPCSCNTFFSCQVTEWKTEFTLAFRAPLILSQWRSSVGFFFFLLSSCWKWKPWGFCGAALTVVLTSIKGHPFLECKSITDDISPSASRAREHLQQHHWEHIRNREGFKNKISFMVFKKKKNPVYVNTKIVCPKRNSWKFTADDFFFTRVKKVWCITVLCL